MERVSDIALDILNELHTEHLAYQSEYLPLVECVNTCSEYEDTGLTPDEIKHLQTENAALKARLSKAVELPCKVGDTVWRVVTTANGENILVDGIIADFTREIHCKDDQFYFRDMLTNYSVWFNRSDFGKTIFLTEAEAQAMLDEMKGGVK